MKAIVFVWVFLPFLVVAQERGNANRASGNINKDAGNVNYYNNTYQQPRKYNTQITPLYFDPNGDMTVSVSGLANVKADSYMAIFNLSQIGKTTQEVNEILNSRINQITAKIKTLPNVKTYIDVISFVPVYEYDTEKKVFSKRTYNEIPKGFEMQKNIHVEYTDPNILETIMSICAEHEVYDLVKVDYYSNNLEAIKKEMATKAKAILKEKIKNYQEILGTDLNVGEKQIVDGFQVFYPVDMYKSYQAYSSANLQQNPSKYEIRPATKNTTYYYQPIINEDFDFVMSNKPLEPTIQIVYEIKFKVKKETKAKEYFWLTPNGEAKPLTIGK